MKKELLYPFDANYILAKKKRIKRELLAEGERFVDKKIAILGGSTTNDIKLILELFLLNQGIRPSFYENITSIMRMQYLIMQNWRHLHRI